MYIDAPVTNLIRGVGKAGKVKIKVSSAGLKSASTEIEVLPMPSPNTIPGISEPILKTDGRTPVNVNLKKANFIKAPSEMKEYAGELRFPVSKKAEYRQLLKEFILKENPSIDPLIPEFSYTISALESILNSTSNYTNSYGYIVADDYNFVVSQFNLSRSITSTIASRNLPLSYRTMLSSYYARQIIGLGKNKNYTFENELIDKIPEGGQAIMIADQGELKEVIYQNETDLKVLLQKIYPNVASYDKDDLKKALGLISRINPTVLFQSIRDKKTKERTDSYTIEPGSIILLPQEAKLLKNSFPDIKL